MERNVQGCPLRFMHMIQASIVIVVVILCLFSTVSLSDVPTQSTYKTISIAGHPKSAGEKLRISVPSSWTIEESSSNSSNIVKVATDPENRRFSMYILVYPMQSNQDIETKKMLDNAVHNYRNFEPLVMAMTKNALEITSIQEAKGCPFPGVTILGAMQFKAGESRRPCLQLQLYNPNTDHSILVLFTDFSKQQSFSTLQLETMRKILASVSFQETVQQSPKTTSTPKQRTITNPSPSPQPMKKPVSIKGHSKAHGESIMVDVPSSWSVEESSMPNIVKTAYASSRRFYVSIVVRPTRLKARGYDTSELTMNLRNPSTCGMFAKTVTSLDFHETASTPATLCGFPAAITTGWYQQMMLGESIPITSRVYVMYDERLDNVIYLTFTGLQQRSFSQEQLNTINEIAATLRKSP